MKHCLYRIFITILCLQAVTSVHAQMEHNAVYKVSIGKMIYANKAEENKSFGSIVGNIASALASKQVTKQQDQYVDAVISSIVKGVGNVRRFRAIEGNFLENEITPEECAFYVDGTIATIATTSQIEPSKDKNNKSVQHSYKGIIGATLNLKDIHTDEVIDSHTFNVSESDCGWVPTAEKAINESLAKLSSRITRHYNAVFPIRGSVIERGEIKKNKQKEVYIDLGTDFSTYEDQHFTVYSLKTIAGKEARLEIGRIKITQVMGNELSLCKVTRGSDKIKTALDGNETVIVISEE